MEASNLTVFSLSLSFDNVNELLVLWTLGIAKLQITNLFFRLSLIILLIYLIFSTIITPTALNKSRNLVKKSGVDTVSNLIKPNAFADTFKGLTFYIGQKNIRLLKTFLLKMMAII